MPMNQLPRQWLAAFLLFAAVPIAQAAADGLVALKSPHGAKETMDRLEAIVKERGLNVFVRVDHADLGAGDLERLQQEVPTRALHAAT